MMFTKGETPVDIELILNTIEESGYLGLYFILWLGIFGMPIPNEVIITTIGFAASQNVLHPIAIVSCDLLWNPVSSDHLLSAGKIYRPANFSVF